MKARQLIEGSTFGPDALKVMGKAFDDAWSEIAPHFSQNGLKSHSARLRLARAVLAFATEDSRDADALKNAALQIVALHYRVKLDPPGPVSA
jgi:hemoglobin-like flavoprotein